MQVNIRTDNMPVLHWRHRLEPGNPPQDVERIVKALKAATVVQATLPNGAVAEITDVHFKGTDGLGILNFMGTVVSLTPPPVKEDN